VPVKCRRPVAWKQVSACGNRRSFPERVDPRAVQIDPEAPEDFIRHLGLDVTCEERREFLAGLVETERLSTSEWESFPENAVFLPPSVRDAGNAVPDFYAGLKAINRRLRCDFFEGVVMSRPRGDSQPVAARRVRESAATGAMRRIPSNSAATRRSDGRGPSIGS